MRLTKEQNAKCRIVVYHIRKSMKSLILIFALFYPNFFYARDKQDLRYSFKKNNLFDEAKQELENFESKHGHFIKTSNARVHNVHDDIKFIMDCLKIDMAIGGGW